MLKKIELMFGEIEKDSSSCEIKIAYDHNGKEHYRDVPTGKFISEIEAINKSY